MCTSGDKPEKEISDFYRDIDQAMKLTKKEKITNTMGELNARYSRQL